MRWPWRQRRAIEPKPMVGRVMELETAKEILEEVFRVRLSDVDEMIQNGFEAAENCCEVAGKNDMVSEENGLWPQEFCLER